MSSHISFCGYLNIMYLLHFRDPKTDIEEGLNGGVHLSVVG